jgi:glycosyltransferase A (GT-A) superfamily protein (DUF2064 family)
MNAVDRALRRAGHAAQLFTGTDLPALVPGDFAAAREALARDDVVLSPADDGGVTLMGARVPWPEFADLPWSTPALGAALERRCREQGLSVRHLAPTWDVDELADLERVRRDLGADPRPARRRLRDRVARVLAASSVA